MADAGVMLEEIHPGEILIEEFMMPLGLTSVGLAEQIGGPVEAILDVVDKRGAISAELAERLAFRFGTKAEFWLNLQADYDRRTSRRPE